MQTLTFHTDAGHGWLQVPRKALFDLGIAASISRYSYVKGDFAFLEEDCDATKYLAALKAHGIAHSIQEKHHAGDSAIRNYVRFNPAAFANDGASRM